MLNENLCWIDEIVKKYLNGNNCNLFKECLYKANLQHKKFYKFYSLDSEYTLTNLKNNLLYFSNPQTFNDPFDCNLGVSPDQFLSLIRFNDISNIEDAEETKNSITVAELGNLFDNITSEQLDDIVSIWKNNCKNTSLYNGTDIPSEEIILQELISNPAVVNDLLSVIIKTDNSEVLDKLSSVSVDALNNIKSGDHSVIPDILQTLDDDSDFIEKSYKLAKISGYSLDEESKNKAYFAIDEIQNKFRETLNPYVGISCFSESYKDVLMWSHYANKHTGICVEYDFSIIKKHFDQCMLFPVIYTKNRPFLPVETIYKYMETREEFFSHVFPNIIKSYLNKSLDWKYEKEWRLFMLLKNKNERLVEFPCVTKIIAGANISEEHLNKLIRISSENKIKLERMILKRDKYELDICNV